MKINKLPVESELAVDEDGNVTGWFRLPAAPHPKYTVSFSVDEVATPEVEEIDLTGVDCQHEETDQQGNCTNCGEKVGGQVEQIQMPDNSVADVTPNTPDTDSGTVASDDKPTD